jgi:hypothetical protein
MRSFMSRKSEPQNVGCAANDRNGRTLRYLFFLEIYSQ